MSSPADRRTFLKATVASGLLGLTKPASTFAAAPAAPAASTDWLEAARAEIPALAGTDYFQTGAFGPSPHRVMERTKALLDLQNQCPAHPENIGQLKDAESACRRLLAETVGAKPSEVAMTANTTGGINTVLWSIDWKAGDEIIIGNQEHPALLLPVYTLQRRFGVVMKMAPVDRPEDTVDAVLQRLTLRTRLVAISHVSRGSGQVLPAVALSRALRERGVPLLLDGAQGPGNVPVDFHALGCDYYSLCGHKWMLGPKGTGALLVREDVLAATAVSWTGSGAQSSMDEEGHFEWQPDARRFEFATRFLAGLGGWHTALQWLGQLGWPRVRARMDHLSAYASEAIRGQKGLELISPADPAQRNGIVVLRMPAGFKATELYDRLRQQDRILVSPVSQPRDLRVCLHFFNTEAEVDRLLARLKVYCG
ncbi:MAG: aminotransferase class V-fold PLP-dependent enzyme [Opitutaceae bacterium]|nr:aminotransferase class V-fold PLP-dependent enzyme [Opitutaceae bacterium]